MIEVATAVVRPSRFSKIRHIVNFIHHINMDVCTSMKALTQGKLLHARLLTGGLEPNAHLAATLTYSPIIILSHALSRICSKWLLR
ncbi:hypothetical protein SUGI_1145040 [Cryptomeria japonica]|nr:hypothetical protein SUGI_1145040 [Cryptomeria japonica]